MRKIIASDSRQISIFPRSSPTAELTAIKICSNIFNMDTTYSHRIQEGEGGVRPLSTVLKTLALLDILASKTHGMRLPEIANDAGLSRATAYQRLLTLIEAGFVEQDEEMRYRLSMHCVRLSAAALEQADIGSRARPVLQNLVDRVKETASLAVMDRGLPCIVSRVDSDAMLRAEQKIGTTMSLEGSASGRVLVAFGDPLTVERLKASGEVLPSPEILEETRRQGFALSSGYTHSGVTAIAAPIFDHRGVCVATLSLVIPDTRFKLQAFREPLLDAAGSLSRTLQGSRNTP